MKKFKTFCIAGALAGAFCVMASASFAMPLIEQANVVEGNTYKPAVKVAGEVYETPFRFDNAEAVEAWVLANVGIEATALRNIGGVDEDAAGNVTGSGTGF